MSKRSVRDRVIGFRADPSLSEADAVDRIGAYVYGNILTFAALVPLTAHAVATGHAVWAVLGVSASTLLAHVFADLVGGGVRSSPGGRPEVFHELRNAAPIVTSATVPCLILLAGWAGWIAAGAAVLISEIYLMIRMAVVGLVVERLHAARPTAWALVAGVVAAVLAAGIAVLKAVIAH